MGETIIRLLDIFTNFVGDKESNTWVRDLANHPNKWSAGHAVFDRVREKLLEADKIQEERRIAQYCFEESCCQAMYNASSPIDPFDESSSFFVVPGALTLAKAVNIPIEAVYRAICPNDQYP